jgi:hypothetical protein
VGGDHDGDEFGGGEAVLYTYGPDADALLDAIRNSFEDFPLRPGAYAIQAVRRSGRPGCPRRTRFARLASDPATPAREHVLQIRAHRPRHEDEEPVAGLHDRASARRNRLAVAVDDGDQRITR